MPTPDADWTHEPRLLLKPCRDCQGGVYLHELCWDCHGTGTVPAGMQPLPRLRRGELKGKRECRAERSHGPWSAKARFYSAYQAVRLGDDIVGYKATGSAAPITAMAMVLAGYEEIPF